MLDPGERKVYIFVGGEMVCRDLKVYSINSLFIDKDEKCPIMKI
jgi:hypothetical protein